MNHQNTISQHLIGAVTIYLLVAGLWQTWHWVAG